MDKDLKNRTLAELAEVIESNGGKPYLAKYLFTSIQAKGAAGLDDVTPLPKALRQTLTDQGFFISRLQTIQILTDSDGTAKFLFGLPDDRRIESVLLKDGPRHTLCISSQVGCRMGCRFCATGQMGYQGNLTAGQIADQVNQVAASGVAIQNIVYMGMGEPLDNFDEVFRSVQILHDPVGRNIGQRHITISTCGIPDGIMRLAEIDMQIRLAISMHAPSDQVRQQIMPIGGSFSIGHVLEAVRRYQRKTGRRVTFEYCLIRGLNDSPTHARAVLRRIEGIKANINLIEFNSFPGCAFEPSDRGRIRQFAQVLENAGIETVIRFKRGQSIQAACGQLGAAWPLDADAGQAGEIL